MSLKTWLVLFIISMALSTEVLLWALRHRQFDHPNRANTFPLRGNSTAPSPRHRPWTLTTILLSLALMFLVWSWGLALLLHQSLGPRQLGQPIAASNPTDN